MTAPELSEHDIQSQILEWLDRKHIFHWRNNTGGSGPLYYKGKRRFVRFGPKGAPDIIAIHKGVPIGIEVKQPGKGLSEAQSDFREEWLSAGGVYIVAMQLEDVTEALDS